MRRGISQRLQQILSPFMDVIAPRICILCNECLVRTGNHHSLFICAQCTGSLSAAPPDEEIYNELIARFPGDALALSSATACYAASPHHSRSLMSAIHSLKYEGMEHIGFELGELLGYHLLRVFGSVELTLVPVPVHPARRRERGYNQAECIAQGAASVVKSRLCTQAIRRTVHKQTQTRLRGHERIRNISTAFTPTTEAVLLHNAEVVVIDDVLTTGATLNALAHCALQCGARRVHAATVVRAR